MERQHGTECAVAHQLTEAWATVMRFAAVRASRYYVDARDADRWICRCVSLAPRSPRTAVSSRGLNASGEFADGCAESRRAVGSRQGHTGRRRRRRRRLASTRPTRRRRPSLRGASGSEHARIRA
ncbi:hypothetical protein K466DRAFT_277465 [Polyporus arcularius HHB13444]|uniref:Uncharacterized protein n=1 Tax=Polyporus arcularius HHB13444 TaxID=1314778 RepID=A0A5C3P060_9APHY|nr:hypothetical protein K466DRAFT_277465 [Polyporus arcularius HHB13444]